MTKPTPKPTVASLKKEIAYMTEQAAIYEQSSQEHAQVREEQADLLDKLRADLAPLLDYIEPSWLGPVQGNYRRLKAFTEGGNG